VEAVVLPDAFGEQRGGGASRGTGLVLLDEVVADPAGRARAGEPMTLTGRDGSCRG
jgi:hypothetical protein